MNHKVDSKISAFGKNQLITFSGKDDSGEVLLGIVFFAIIITVKVFMIG